MVVAVVVHVAGGAVRSDRLEGGHISVTLLREDPLDRRAIVIASEAQGGRVSRRLHVSEFCYVDVEEGPGD